MSSIPLRFPPTQEVNGSFLTVLRSMVSDGELEILESMVSDSLCYFFDGSILDKNSIFSPHGTIVG